LDRLLVVAPSVSAVGDSDGDPPGDEAQPPTTASDQIHDADAARLNHPGVL